MKGTKLGESLEPLAEHMEELSNLSIQEKCKVIMHGRLDMTYQPLQCRVTLAVETLHLRRAGPGNVAGRMKARTGPRELQAWLEVME